MQNQLSMTVEKVKDVLQKEGSLSLTNLESTVNVSYNLLFLAIDHLTAEHKIGLRKNESDYIIFIKP